MAEKHLGSVLGEAGSRRRAVQAKACSCRVTVQSSGWCRQWTERTEGCRWHAAAVHRDTGKPSIHEELGLGALCVNSVMSQHVRVDKDTGRVCTQTKRATVRTQSHQLTLLACPTRCLCPLRSAYDAGKPQTHASCHLPPPTHHPAPSPASPPPHGMGTCPEVRAQGVANVCVLRAESLHGERSPLSQPCRTLADGHGHGCPGRPTHREDTLLNTEAHPAREERFSGLTPLRLCALGPVPGKTQGALCPVDSVRDPGRALGLLMHEVDAVRLPPPGCREGDFGAHDLGVSTLPVPHGLRVGTRGALAGTCPTTESCCQTLTGQPPAVQLPAQDAEARGSRCPWGLSVQSNSSLDPAFPPSRHRSKALNGCEPFVGEQLAAGPLCGAVGKSFSPLAYFRSPQCLGQAAGGLFKDQTGRPSSDEEHRAQVVSSRSTSWSQVERGSGGRVEPGLDPLRAGVGAEAGITTPTTRSQLAPGPQEEEMPMRGGGRVEKGRAQESGGVKLQPHGDLRHDAHTPARVPEPPGRLRTRSVARPGNAEAHPQGAQKQASLHQDYSEGYSWCLQEAVQFLTLHAASDTQMKLLYHFQRLPTQRTHPFEDIRKAASPRLKLMAPSPDHPWSLSLEALPGIW
ncbi:hypothetical protein PANDA_013753 [Ailuropoda melanoleuca]|uniref:Orange domain-containing protein n=1 Tax=Ailuropoda melanoleuca TaxID=9646 RepID=D2HPP1_AILME|nr:hypothetical protein PANDA_013753 [Ailuropoda melanoleuca]